MASDFSMESSMLIILDEMDGQLIFSLLVKFFKRVVLICLLFCVSYHPICMFCSLLTEKISVTQIACIFLETESSVFVFLLAASVVLSLLHHVVSKQLFQKKVPDPIDGLCQQFASEFSMHFASYALYFQSGFCTV